MTHAPAGPDGRRIRRASIVELASAMASAHQSDVMMADHDVFRRIGQTVSLIGELGRYHTEWTCVAGTAGVLGLAGLILNCLGWLPMLSTVMRAIGLMLGAFMWSVFGLSFLLGLDHSFVAAPLLALGLGAMIALPRLAFPSPPEPT